MLEFCSVSCVAPLWIPNPNSGAAGKLSENLLHPTERDLVIRTQTQTWPHVHWRHFWRLNFFAQVHPKEPACIDTLHSCTLVHEGCVQQLLEFCDPPLQMMMNIEVFLMSVTLTIRGFGHGQKTDRRNVTS